MKLNIEQIKSITRGAVEVIETENGFVFRRFTKEQTESYKIYRDEIYAKKTLTNAGVRFAFETDSKNFSFTYGHYSDYSAGFGWFEIFVNGEECGHFPLDFARKNCLAKADLGDGVKTVEVYFPWQKNATVSDVTFDDGSYVKPVKRSRTMLTYGDSITHGHFTQSPSRSYTLHLAKLLDADCFNKAIGGDRFFPEVLDIDEPVTPDIITVAYGTNDWWIHSRQTVTRRSREYMVKLSQKFPMAKIFVISPIRRAGGEVGQKFDGYLPEVLDILKMNAESLSNVTVIDGWELVPDAPSYFTDGLHPNDFGMVLYAEKLYNEIKKYIEVTK